jgi:hypothetical protein
MATRARLPALRRHAVPARFAVNIQSDKFTAYIQPGAPVESLTIEGNSANEPVGMGLEAYGRSLVTT